MLPRAGNQTAGELRAALRAAVIAVDPDAAEKRRKAAVKERSVSRYTRHDGMSAIEAVLSAVDTGEIYELVDDIARASKTTGDTRTADARRADALVFLILGRDPHLGPEHPQEAPPDDEPPPPPDDFLPVDDDPPPPWQPPDTAPEDPDDLVGDETAADERAAGDGLPDDAAGDAAAAAEPAEAASAVVQADEDKPAATDAAADSAGEAAGTTADVDAGEGAGREAAADSAPARDATGTDPAADERPADPAPVGGGATGDSTGAREAAGTDPAGDSPSSGDASTDQAAGDAAAPGAPTSDAAADSEAPGADPESDRRSPGDAASGGPFGLGVPWPDEPADLDDRFPPPSVPVEPDGEATAGEPSRAVSELVARCMAALAARRPRQPPWVAITERVTPTDTVTLAHLHGEGPITAEYARYLLAVGAAQPPPPDPTDIPLTELQRRTHDPPPKLAAAIRARDGTCRAPGCRSPSHRGDNDHTISFPDGPTAPENLAALCRRHHRLKHHGGWTLTQDHDATLTWTSPTGHSYMTYPRGHDDTSEGTTALAATDERAAA